MSHGVNKKAPPIVSPLPLPLTRFSPGFFVVLQAMLYQPFALIRLSQKIIHFQNQIFSFNLLLFNLLLVGFDLAVLCICVSKDIFSKLCHHKTTNRLIFAYMHSFPFGLSLNCVA